MAKRKRPWAWDKLRAELLRLEPLCRICLASNRVTAAAHVDHIVPTAKGGALLDPMNCRPLCVECHKDVTNAQFGKRVRVTIGLDGWPV
jgi:5-methylcytosine-specific restriction endonuclease McrA